MSNRTEGRGPIPPRWLHCPRKAIKVIQNKFLAFKTPLCAGFDSQVPEECRFTIDMLFASLKSQRLKLGLWIDLTNTTRFYDKKSIEAYGCRYLKLPCRGHAETPSEEQTKTFIQVCKNFIAQNPLEIIGIHCTHGFNRTGFCIVSYLVETDGTSVDAGLVEFSSARPPGIYKADYIQELYRRYDDVEDAPDPPPSPAWCLEYDDSNVEDRDEGPSMDNDTQEPPSKKRRKEFTNKNPTFMAGVPGVTAILDERKLRGIQRRVQQICGWKSTGFPGSQPVSMNVDNIRLLCEKPYRVSWKADGTRYMMMVQADGEVYFVDRDNSVFQVSGLTFPHKSDRSRCIRDTLLDGEMVIDKDKADGREYPRYLVYDVIMYDGEDVSKLPFHPNRYAIIGEDIMNGRHRALREGRIRKETEPFSVRIKNFFDINQAANLLGPKFAAQLSHEPDGLIFQPAKMPYCPGTSVEVLKWKPPSMNSIDFRLKIVTETGEGILPQKVGHLYVGGSNMPYGKMKVTKQIKDLNNAIIECTYENGQWVYMRVRSDKSFPNSLSTADAVRKSIHKPVTKEILLNFINTHGYIPNDADLMPPPDRTVLLWCAKDLAAKDKKSLRVNIEFDHATMVRWSPDGKAFIIHKALGNTVEVYKVAKKSDGFLASATKAIEFPQRHTHDVVGMDIACTGKYIITCSKSNDLIIWDLKGQILATIELHLGSTYRARVSPCGRFVAVAGFTPDVNVWEVVFSKSGEFKTVAKAFDLAGHTSGIYDFGFNADTGHMATVSRDTTYRFYDTKIEYEKGEDPHILVTGSWSGKTPARLALSPNAEVLAIAHGSSLSFYSTFTGKLDNTINDIFLGPVAALAFNAVGDYVLVAGDKQIKIFRNVTGYRTAIESAKRKLAQRQTSATKERLEKLLVDHKSLLQAMGEPYLE